MELYEQKEHVERVILVGIQTGDSDPAEASLDELGELAQTAGAVVVGRMIQNREQMHPATYIGTDPYPEKRVPPESCCAGRLHVGRKEQY